MLPLLDLLPHPPPRLTLGRFPSPLERHDGLGHQLGFESLLVKRDDLNAESIGGNKLRALEWLLPATGPGIVSMGGFGSTYAAALARHGGAAGRRVAVALFPTPWTPSVAAVLAATAAHAQVVLARSRRRLPFAIRRAWKLAAEAGAPTWIPAGGAEPLGVLGSVNAALEFAEQLRAKSIPSPDVVVVPLGTGATAAGLWLGLALAGVHAVVCAVPVADRWLANRLTIRWLAWRTRRLLARYGLKNVPSPGALLAPHEHLGQGYGHPTEEGIRALELLRGSALELDPTYTAKAFAALRTLGGSYRRPCFWHTFDSRVAIPPPTGAHAALLAQARVYSEALWPFPKSI